MLAIGTKAPDFTLMERPIPFRITKGKKSCSTFIQRI